MDCILKTIKVWYNKLRRTEINGRIFLCSWIEELTLLKFPTPKHKFKVVPIKNLIVFFTKIEKNSEICVESQNNSQKILKKKNKAGDIMLLDFKLYYKLS